MPFSKTGQLLNPFTRNISIRSVAVTQRMCHKGGAIASSLFPDTPDNQESKLFDQKVRSRLGIGEDCDRIWGWVGIAIASFPLPRYTILLAIKN